MIGNNRGTKTAVAADDAGKATPMVDNGEVQDPLEEAKDKITNWFKQNRFKQNKIDMIEDIILNMAEEMVDGTLKINEQGLFTYKLTQPIGNPEAAHTYFEEVTLKNRMTYQQHVKQHMHKVKNGDTASQVLAYACGASGLHMNQLHSLDTRDLGFIRNYALLFF